MADSTYESEIEDLRRRLEEAEETLRAIRSGEIDALIVHGPEGERIYTLEGAERPYRILIESMQQGALTLDADTTILYCNQCFCDMLGQPPHNIVGRSLAEYLPRSQHDAFRVLFNSGRSAAVRREFPLRGAGGLTLPVCVAFSPLGPDSGLVGAVITDLTDTKKQADLQETNRRKDEFLATLAHELRNPLAPICNSLQIMKMPQLDAGTAQHITEVMERQVHQLVRLVDDLLDVSRVMRGKIELRREPIELASVVARAVETARPLIDAQGHTLEVTMPEESVLLNADAVRLAQVVGNLLLNAAKYTEPNGNIWVTGQREGDTAVLRVRDSGIGIHPDVLPNVFDLFVQDEHITSRAQGGLGVGLTLVKSLVEMHRGTVEAHSAGQGQGSEFTVRLPILRSRAKVHSADGNHRHVQAQPTGHKLLVVDDNFDAANMLSLLLRLRGHEVRVARDGAEALEVLREFHPELVFLDIGMPGMDGYEVARRIRQMPELDGVVLAALTGWGQHVDRTRSTEAGFNHHLVKPPDPDLLEGLIGGLKQPTG